MTEPVIGTAIFAEQVYHLYRLSRPAYVATLVNAVVVTIVLWDAVPNTQLLAWLGTMTATVGARYAGYVAYFRAPRVLAEAKLWARRFIVGAGATGLIWGILASALFPPSMPHQFFVIFLIGGMVLSAMVILAPVRRAFLAYMLPLMALTTATVFAQGGNLYLFMGVLLLVFMGVLLGASPVLSDMILESVRVKFENSALVERISQVNRDLSERIGIQQRVEEVLRQSEQRYRYLFEANPVPMWIREEATLRMRAVNAAALETYGYSKEEFLRLESTDLLVPEEVERFLEDMRTRDPLQGHRSQRRHRRKDGSVMEVEVVSYPFELDGRTCRLALAHDETERNRTERLHNLETAVTVLLADAASTEEVMPRVLEAMCHGLGCACGARWVLDSKDRVLRRSETWCVADPEIDVFRTTSTSTLEISGQPGGLTRKVWATGAAVWLADVARDPTFTRGAAATRAGLRSAFAFPLLVGGEFYGVLEFFGSAVRPRDDGVLGIAQTVGSHIGQFIGRMRAEHSLQFFASHDPLTGLFNRGIFGERLHQALAQAQRFERTLALLFIDLDGFKAINDTLGHSAGDLALVEIAARLRATLREGDVIARMGGDEFVVLIEEFGDAVQIAEVAKKVLETIGKPIVLQAQDNFVTASIGVSTYPHDAADAPTLLKNADAAMYRAKEGGKNNFRFFAPEMNTHLVERVSLESGLRHALEREEFTVLYQPRVSLRTGLPTGVEALLRWRHPTQGTIGPLEFVPIAEDNGLMNTIGGWVLSGACAQARAWQDQGLPPLKMAVNLSARQFAQEDLIQIVREELHRAGLEPGRLELEITEAMLMRNPERAARTLSQLRELGVRATLDDFGTGYASLGYLTRCPVDGVNLDRSFVLKLPGDTESAAVARAVIAVARSLKLHITAEGVETREQWELLRELGCDDMQGNHFSEPVAAELLPDLLQQAPGAGRRTNVQQLRPRRDNPDPE